MLVETVLKKSLMAMPFLFFVFLVYGINHEHGDSNAGSMYPIAFALPGLGFTVVSYILYFYTDKLTCNSKLNVLKNFVHLILVISFFAFHDKGAFVVISLTLTTILAVNLIMIFANTLKKDI